MKTLAARIQEVRAWVATHTSDRNPDAAHYIMELDAITHEVQLLETCPHGVLSSQCRKCKAVRYRKEHG